MNAEIQIRELEAALLARARALVREHLDKAAAERDRILSECAHRLRLAEEREMLVAKADADRLFRRRVQAAGIRMQGELDRLRWTLVQAVVGQVRARLVQLAEDEAAYAPVLAGFLGRACGRMDEGALVAELNARDHQRYAGRWGGFAAAAVPGRQVTLAPAIHPGSGGVIVRTSDNRVRIDNTFEGRLDRLQDEVDAAIVERLFASVPHMEALLHG